MKSKHRFPPGFLFGTATSAYQIEGAWDEDGKGESIWDQEVHTTPEVIRDESNGDIACDSYHRYKEDVAMLKDLGVHFYRFSISWPRILPNGYGNVINKAGIDYYNNLINELIANEIEPMVTMYHWDLPQPLQDIGGWPNPVIADYFEDYARILYTNFGDRVKWWCTINEPTSVMIGYSIAVGMAPNLNTLGHGEYLAMKTMQIAHAKAYRLYGREFRETQKGKVGLVHSANWHEPNSCTDEDKAAVERAHQFNTGWVLHPIYSQTGGYPPLMKEWMAKKSKQEGEPKSRLPEFTKEELELVKGTWDYLGLNHYTTFYVSDALTGFSLVRDAEVTLNQNPNAKTGSSFWLQMIPFGLRKIVNWLSTEYGRPPIFVTENGFSDHGELNDTDRIEYYSGYLRSLAEAINEDGCNVIGYTAWSLMDNFEWASGYTEKFGLYHVDFSDPKRKRTPKASAEYYKKIIELNEVPPQFVKSML